MARYQPRHRGSEGQRTVLVAVVALVVVLVVSAGGAAAAAHLRHHRTKPPQAARGGSLPGAAVGAPAAAPVGAKTGIGAISVTDATHAAWVIAENRMPGTTAWELVPSVGGASIEGYADHTSAEAGQTVKLYVSTPAPGYHVDAFRMGYYGGAGARLIWSSPALTGQRQDRCPVNAPTNMVECSWTASVAVPISASWPQGEYLFKLMADPGQQSYIPLTVWDPSSHATYVIQSSLLTWQAWNDYGGYSNFGGPAAHGPSPSFSDRARVLSFDRPYAKGSGSSDFLGLEFPLISFAEQHGLDVSYWTDIDFSENPQLLTNHKALLSLGHNEFVTSQERQGEVDGLTHGVNLAFLGATPDLRPARLQASPLGTDREEVAYRDAREDPLSKADPNESTPNTWDQAPIGKPASRIVGDTYGGYGINAALVVAAPVAWPFAGTTLAAGSQLPHVVLGDYDNYLPGRDSPANVQILAHSAVVTSYGHSGSADMTYYTVAESNAGVFATGSIGWIPSLAPCAATVALCPAADVATITGNVLRLFGSGPAALGEPSTPNWRNYYRR